MLLLVTWIGADLAVAQDGPQDVTIRELNQYDDLTSLNSINNHPLVDETVRFTAVVVSDPLKSGLASITDLETTGGEELQVPGRVHVFVIDTTAASEGRDGMAMHIVASSTFEGNMSPSYDAILSAQIGDIIEVTGSLTFYESVVQFDPLTSTEGIQLLGSVHEEFFSNLADLIEPTVIKISDLNEETEEGSGLHSMRIDQYSNYVNRYVRFEQVETFATDNFDDGRYNMLFSDGSSFIYTRDTSLRFRNDKLDYSETTHNFDYRDTDDQFSPPSSGSLVNTSGFLVVNANDGFSVEGAEPMFGYAPFEDSDLEVIGNPPLFAGYSISDTRPGTDDQVTIGVQALTAEDDENIESVNVVYTSTGAEEVTAEMTSSGNDTYEYTFPTFSAYDVVSFRIDASMVVDFEGEDITITARLRDGDITADSDDAVQMQFLVGEIDRIIPLNRTANQRYGFGPLVNAGITNMNVTGTIMSTEEDGFIVIHDSNEKWSGILIHADDDEDLLAVNRGDKVNITEGEVISDFDNTYLKVTAFTILSETESDIESLIPVVTPAEINNPTDRGKPYFGMFVKLEDVFISSINADAAIDENYGEWAIAAQADSPVSLRINNQVDPPLVRHTNNIPANFNDGLNLGAHLDALVGLVQFSFSNPKLALRGIEDIHVAEGHTIVSVESDDVQPREFELSQNYPNPFNPTTNINFVMPEQAHVRLTVYDILGRQVATLVNEVVASGSHTVNFDASTLSSGMYIYRMETGNITKTNKMMLIK